MSSRATARSPRKPARARPVAAVPARRGRRQVTPALRAAREALYQTHILQAAERIFAEQGFDETRMQDIARAAGLSLATLYQAYPGKAGLYRAILIARDGEMLNTVMSRGRQVLQQPQTIERLLWLMETHLRFLLQHPDYLRMQLQQGHAWYHATAWPSREEQQMWERGLAAIAQVLAWGQAGGLFVPGDVADQARMMLAMQQTRLANWVGAGMKESQDVLVARIQADFVRNFCRPKQAARLLSPEGSQLAADTLARIRATESSEPG